MLSITDIIITFVTGAVVTAIITAILLWVERRYSIKRLQTEKFLNWLHRLNTQYYSNLASYSGYLSKALRDKRLPKDEALIEWCLYLIYRYIYYGEKFKSAGGIYLVFSVEGMRDVLKLSQLMYGLLLDCFKERLQELANLGDLEYFKFKEYLKEEHNDILEKFREWIGYEKNRKELVVFSYLYSELLSAEVLSTYGFHYKKVKRVFSLGRLYKSARKVIELYESKKVIERNIDELTKIVNEYSKRYGYDDVCAIEVSEKLLVFEKSFFGFVKFREDFPWVIYVKKENGKELEPIKKFKYETKYKHIEEALERSQRIKEKIDKGIL